MAQAPKISRIEAVVNVASGGANAQDAEQMRALLAGYGAHANVQVADSGEIERRLRSAVDAAPDLLVILAGDGTARMRQRVWRKGDDARRRRLQALRRHPLAPPPATHRGTISLERGESPLVLYVLAR